jgi:hypothetical protein
LIIGNFSAVLEACRRFSPTARGDAKESIALPPFLL